MVELDEEGMRLVCLGRVRRGRGGEFCMTFQRLLKLGAPAYANALSILLPT